MPHDLDAQEFGRTHAAEERLRALNVLAAEIASTSGLVGVSVPHFQVQQLGAQTHNPSVITFASRPGGRAGLARMADGDLVARAGEIVRTIAPVLGVPAGQAAEFSTTTGVTDVAGAVRVVRVAQHHQGIPIFHAQSALHFDSTDQPRTLLAKTFTVAAERRAPPAVSAAAAVRIAAVFVTTPPAEPERDQFGNVVTASPPVDLTGFEPRLLAQRPGAERAAAFDGGPFATPIRASLVWFPRTLDDLRLTWEVEIAVTGAAARYRTLVDAHTADVLYARQLVQGITATASVFTRDPQSARETVTLPLPATAYGVPVPADLAGEFPRDWVEGERTLGNSTVAFFGTDQPLAATGAAGGVSFAPSSETGADQQVLNAFYFACRLHDLFYLLGFREKDWNFQADNAPQGGTGGDPVRVEVHPGSVQYTANMTTFVEGTSPVLQLGLHEPTGRHCALDGTVVVHEFCHGVTNRLVGGPSDIRSLDDKQCRGMGEGWGDYFACMMLDVETIGSWLVDDREGIRARRYDQDFPADRAHFGKLGAAGFRDEHAVGEVWCGTLLEMTRRVGTLVGMRLVVHALKLSPANPSFLDMRDAILAAADVLVEVGDLAEDALATTREGIWAAFATFGMGPSATSDDATYRNIAPDFTVPAHGTTQNPFTPPRAPATIVLETIPGQPVALTPEAPDAESTLTAVDLRPVRSITVSVDLDHPAPHQVRVTLRCPGGRAILHNGPTSAGPLPAEFASESHPALGTLLGQPAAGAWSLLVVDLGGTSTGALRSWRLTLGLGAGAEVGEASPGVPIPDDFAAGVTSPVTLSGDGRAARIDVELVVTHPQPADLVLELEAPSGRRAVLRALDEPAGGAVQSYHSGSSERLAALVGEAVPGQWTLRVADLGPRDVGTLDRWRLTVRAAPEA